MASGSYRCVHHSQHRLIVMDTCNDKITSVVRSRPGEARRVVGCTNARVALDQDDTDQRDKKLPVEQHPASRLIKSELEWLTASNVLSKRLAILRR